MTCELGEFCGLPKICKSCIEKQSKLAHGGNRKGSGRPKVPYKSITVRVPVACLEAVKSIISAFKSQSHSKQLNSQDTTKNAR